MIRVTKMELLKLEKKKEILKKSIVMLKKKRDSLINMIVNSIDKSKAQYQIFSEIEDSLVDEFKKVYVDYPTILLKIDAHNQPSYFNIGKEVIHFLNISWLVLNPEMNLNFMNDNYYILRDNDLNGLKKEMTRFVMAICAFGTTINNVSAFLSEVRKLTRRINFLEKTRLPSFEKEIDRLRTILDEKEREEIIRLKMIKESNNSKQYEQT